MIIYDTKESAEEARRTDKLNSEKIPVKVSGGYTLMSVREYINWLVKQ